MFICRSASRLLLLPLALLLSSATCEPARNPDEASHDKPGGEPGALTAEEPIMRFDTNAEEAYGRVTFFPDGTRLAAYHLRGVCVWDLCKEKQVAYLTSRFPTGCGLAISPDSMRLAISDGDSGAVQLWDTRTWKTAGTVTHDWGKGAGSGALAFSPDGKQLALGRGKKVVLWDLAAGAEVVAFGGHGQRVVGLTFSPDGAWLASAERPTWVGHINDDPVLIKVWDVTAKKEVLSLTKVRAAIEALTFSRDGKLLAGGALDSAVRVWDIPSGKERLVLQDKRLLASVAFSKDGKTLITSGVTDDDERIDMIYFWDVNSGKQVQALKAGGRVTDLAVSPDGTLLAASLLKGGVAVWSLAGK
jgi:WD40 repeat protein